MPNKNFESIIKGVDVEGVGAVNANPMQFEGDGEPDQDPNQLLHGGYVEEGDGFDESNASGPEVLHAGALPRNAGSLDRLHGLMKLANDLVDVPEGVNKPLAPPNFALSGENSETSSMEGNAAEWDATTPLEMAHHMMEETVEDEGVEVVKDPKDLSPLQGLDLQAFHLDGEGDAATEPEGDAITKPEREGGMHALAGNPQSDQVATPMDGISMRVDADGDALDADGLPVVPEAPKPRRGRKSAEDIKAEQEWNRLNAKRQEAIRSRNLKRAAERAAESNRILQGEGVNTQQGDIILEVFDLACKHAVEYAMQHHESAMFTKEFSHKLLQGWLDGEVDGSNPLFATLLQECAGAGVTDPFLGPLTARVLLWVMSPHDGRAT